MQLREWRPLNKNRPHEFVAISSEALKVNDRTVAKEKSTMSPSPSIFTSNYCPIDESTLVQSADLYAPKRCFTFYGALWHRKGDQEWLAYSAHEWTDNDGNRQFTAQGRFSSHGDQRRFSEAAIAAIKLAAA